MQDTSLAIQSVLLCQYVFGSIDKLTLHLKNSWVISSHWNFPASYTLEICVAYFLSHKLSTAFPK